MATRLDRIAQQVRSESPHFMNQPPKQKAIELAEFLRQYDLTGISGKAHYHDLQNNFIGIALRDEGHPSLPLVSVIIYCCVAQRLGIDAQPCGFPFHVLAIIKLPQDLTFNSQCTDHDSSIETIYMDPFRSNQEVNVQALQAQLDNIGIPKSSSQELLRASSTAEMVRRSAKNIMTSLQAMRRDIGAGHSCPDVNGALYAAIWAISLLPEDSTVTAGEQRAECLTHMISLIEKYSLADTWLVERYILPLIDDHGLHEQLRNAIRAIRTMDYMPKKLKDRTSDSSPNIQYKVGQVFYHKRYHYKAVITGWDVECTATDEWMAHMGVHNLSRGQHQGFYHVL